MVWNGEAERYHSCLTNLPPEVLSTVEVAELYPVRWDIELRSKEMKGQHALDKLKTAHATAVEAPIHMALLSPLVSRRTNNLGREKADPEYRVRYTQQRWWILFRENSSRMLAGMLSYLGQATHTGSFFEGVVGACTSEAVDLHVH